MTQIFVSYRRSDSASISGRIFDRLLTAFGRSAVFKDVDSIPAGANFREYIDSVLSQVIAELVIIGPKWLVVTKDDGTRRLDDPLDWVRIEVEVARERGALIIPLLVEDASMPNASDLPSVLAFLADCQALHVHNDPDFNNDMRRVVASLLRQTNLTTLEPVALDDAEPDEARQVELNSAYDQNQITNRAPYDNVQLYTRGELRWILRERKWVGGEPGAHRIVANLQGISLAGVNLTGMSLQYADLRNANLRGAILRATECYGADLRGADLRRAQMDSATSLAEIKIDDTTRLGDVVWNGVPLTLVNWDKVYRLGDENDLDEKVRMERRRAFRNRRDYVAAINDVARAYQGLSITLRAQGISRPASRYRLMAKRLERQSLWIEGRFPAYALSVLLNMIAGYGERPTRTLYAYITVVAGFAAAYWFVSNVGVPSPFPFNPPLLTAPAPLTWYDALILSLTAFHGRGFFNSTLNVGDSISGISVLEAVVGLFIEVTFISTFGRRFSGE